MLLSIFWLLFYPTTFFSADEALEQLMIQKEIAVQQGDWHAYQQTLSQADPFYIQEKKRWFQDVVRTIEPKSFRLKILKRNQKAKDLYEVWIEQSYQKRGEQVTVRYPLRVKKTARGWKDHDFPFQSVGDGRIQVYFTHPFLEKEAQIAFETIELAQKRLEEKFAWVPKQIEVKLYHRPEWFWQSVKPSLPHWAIGWHEADQAIKLVGGVMEPSELKASIVHELVHQMVSELTNDNAAYWLQEGTASYYEKHLLSAEKEFVNQTPHFLLSQLEKIHLESLPSQEAAKYYESCYLLVGFIVREYQEVALLRLFHHLKQEDYIDQDSDQKLAITALRTKKSLQKSLAISTQQLDEKWLQKRE